VPARPRLKPHLRVLRRGPQTVQLGLEPEAGLVLEGVSGAEAAWVASLDGTRTFSRAIDDAVAAGIPAERARDLVTLLRAHDALVDSPASRWHFANLRPEARGALGVDATALAARTRGGRDGYALLADRASQRVAVAGAGPLPYEVTALLRAAGAQAVLLGSYAGGPGGVPGGDALWPSLAVLVGALPLQPGTASAWQAAGVRHLPVAMGTTTALVGPVVHPGGTACLQCMEMTRCDLDPAWPSLLAQTAPRAIGPVAAIDAETSLLALTAAVTAMAALAALDGEDGRTGLSLEVALPWPEVTQRRWVPHPRCDCGAASRSSDAPGPGTRPPDRTTSVRMAR
jgi:bacteriocin biosynthesis cyclodehydratase domain-containing protein